MTKAVQKITLSPSRDIPFNKLVLSQSNVRRVKAGISIEQLAESIAQRTLLQSLSVRAVLDAEGNETGIDLVIGADGLHSSVRQLAFGPSARFERHLGYMVAAFEVRGYRPRDEDVYLMYGKPGRMVGRFTLHDDRTLFLFVFVAPNAVLPATLPQQKALLDEVYAHDGWECPKILAELARADTIYRDSVSQIRMQNWTRGRVALIGDAAFCVSLLAGQGSALAMISAYVMAGELAAAHGRYQEAFVRYGMRLRDYISAKQNTAERFAGAFAPKTWAGLFFRNQVIRAFALPGLAKLSIGRGIADRLELPNYRWPLLHEDASDA